MAKKSNKTAHVLNLLSGHDTAKEANELSMEEDFSGEEMDETFASAPDSPEPSDNGGGTATAPPDAPALQPNPASVKAPAASQNNISLIDKTGEDPVADLIQEKLSSEFEKHMQESQTKDSEAPQASIDPESSSLADEKVNSNEISVEDESVVSDTDSVEDEGVVSDTASVEDEGVVSDTDSIEDEISVSGTDSAKDEGSVSDTGFVDDGSSASDTDFVDDESSVSDTDFVDDEGTVSDTDSMEDRQEGLASAPAESGENISETTLAEASSVEDADLQEALEQNRIENADSLSEAEEEMGAMAKMDADLEAKPTSTEQTASSPQPATPEPEPEPEFAAVNVMERIVHDKIIYFMRQFDVCTCDRCKADVVALTLNGLMPKYIVTMPAAVDPLISYYTNRLISDVTVEATKACMTVKENPRH